MKYFASFNAGLEGLLAVSGLQGVLCSFFCDVRKEQKGDDHQYIQVFVACGPQCFALKEQVLFPKKIKDSMLWPQEIATEALVFTCFPILGI